VVQSFSGLVAREDAEVRLHPLQTMTAQFQLCECGHCRLGKLHRCSEIFNISTERKEAVLSEY
jgi:aerobic-type carbon monoxide dehydrogenase small subunit (CoxS/CutS family)